MSDRECQMGRAGVLAHHFPGRRGTPSLSVAPSSGGRVPPSHKIRRWPAARFGPTLLLLAGFCGLSIRADSTTAPVGFSMNFEQFPPGKPPEELMILNGTFNVVEDAGNKCLELSPDPVEGDGFLFGPPGQVTGTVSARIWGSATGKRFPEFGIGANDAGGYKLILVPALGVLELRKGDDAKASVPCPWKSGSWIRFKLRVSKAKEGGFQLDGKTWPDGKAEPAAWCITAHEPESPAAGRASAWAMPYSETPIRFDDLQCDP